MLLHEATFVHAKPASGQRELVESYRDHRRAVTHQCREQLVVEFTPKFRVLLGSPFIQQQDRTLLQQTHNEREAFALASGQIDGAELTVGYASLVGQSVLRQELIDLGGIRIRNPVETLK